MKGLAKHVAALSLGVVAMAAPLQAQSPAQFSLGGSLGIPLGDFDDAAKMGFHGLAAVGFTPATMPVGFQIDGNFAQFSTEADDVNVRNLFATGNVVYKFATAETSTLRPYLIGGLGVYNLKETGDGVIGDPESVTELGLNAGAGFNMAAGGASLFVEGRFHNVFTDGSSTQFIPLTVGIRLGGN
jgi:hypothetical protein